MKKGFSIFIIVVLSLFYFTRFGFAEKLPDTVDFKSLPGAHMTDEERRQAHQKELEEKARKKRIDSAIKRLGSGGGIEQTSSTRTYQCQAACLDTNRNFGQQNINISFSITASDNIDLAKKAYSAHSNICSKNGWDKRFADPSCH